MPGDPGGLRRLFDISLHWHWHRERANGSAAASGFDQVVPSLSAIAAKATADLSQSDLDKPIPERYERQRRGSISAWGKSPRNRAALVFQG